MTSRICFGSNIDSLVTVTGTGTAVTGFEPANVQDPSLDKSWRAPSGASTRILSIEYLTNQTVFFVLVATPARKPITGSITVRLKDSGGSTLASGTIARQAFGALDRRIFSVGASGLALVRKVEVEIPTGMEIGRVVVDVLNTDVDTYIDRSVLQRDWGVEPNEPVRTQFGTKATLFAETARPISGGYLAPVRKRRMTVTMPLVQYLSRMIRHLRLADLDEVTAIIRNCDSRTATTAEIEAMHAHALYGRSAQPQLTTASLDGTGNPDGDRWNIRFQLDERA